MSLYEVLYKFVFDHLKNLSSVNELLALGFLITDLVFDSSRLI